MPSLTWLHGYGALTTMFILNSLALTLSVRLMCLGSYQEGFVGLCLSLALLVVLFLFTGTNSRCGSDSLPQEYKARMSEQIARLLEANSKLHNENTNLRLENQKVHEENSSLKKKLKKKAP